MHRRRRRHRPPTPPALPGPSVLRLGLTAALVLAACHDSTPPTGPGPTGPGPGTPPSAAPAGVAITPDSARLRTGDTLRLSARVRDSAGNVLDDAAVTWNSSRPAVAAVDSTGLVTALDSGSADIVARAGPAQGEARVRVRLVPVAAVRLTPDSLVLRRGGSAQLALTAFDSAGDTLGLAGRAVTWSSSNEGVASIAGYGVLEATGAGTAVVRAEVESRSDSAIVRVVQVTAGLSPQDSARLTRSLEAISQGTPWPRPAADTAGLILADPAYGPDDWRAYFAGYLARDRLTQPLRWYLQGSLFYHAYNATTSVEEGLQAGIGPAAMDRLRLTMAAEGTAIGSAFVADPSLREGMTGLHALLNQLVNLGSVPGQPASILDFYVGHVRSFAFLFAQPSVLTGDLQRASPLRLQAWINLVEAAASTGASPSVVEEALALEGPYRTIFEHSGVVVNDNDGFSARQLDAIRTYLDSLPPGLLHLSSISQMDLLGNVDPTLWPVSGAPNPYGGFDRNSINIFAVDVGAASEDAFPDDVEPRVIDGFSSALVHETNHVVDCCHVKDDTTLRRREAALIAAAGADSLNYLRSMFPAGFFQNAPQEFFASISNEWFDDSEQVFRLGRVRFDAGRPQPLNQALFFAEVYSRGGASVPLYRIDRLGGLTRRRAPVTRDAYGHIVSLVIGDSTLTFTRQPSGDVIGYRAEGA